MVYINIHLKPCTDYMTEEWYIFNKYQTTKKIINIVNQHQNMLIAETITFQSNKKGGRS